MQVSPETKHSAKRTLFVTAMRLESRAILKSTNFREIKRTGRFRIYHLAEKQFFVLETGIGIPGGAKILRELIAKVRPARLINYGLCGALQTNIPRFTTYLTNEVCMLGRETISLPVKQSPEIPKILPSATLLTVAEPVLERQMRETLFRQTGCPVVDMEAYFIAEASLSLGISPIILKMVSDMADETAVADVKRDKFILQKKLEENLSRLISTLQI